MDLYDILSIQSNSTNEEITKAYKKLAKIYHPDKKTGDTEKFQQIHYAYNILINDTTRLKYNDMKKPTKTKLTSFLSEWFKNDNNSITNSLSNRFSNNIKKFFNMNDIDLKNIISNIEFYDFNDLMGLFNKHIIPDKKNNIIDCSDTETPYWDEMSAEYYSLNYLPLKYHIYNNNNIKLDLKCTINEIETNRIRKIKIKRKQNNEFIETSYYFNCSHPIIVFNNGGDNDGHLIIYLSLPENYIWTSDNIFYNIDINLYQYIYGLNIKYDKYIFDNYIPYKEGNIINLKYIDKYFLSIKLNIIYNHTDENKEKLLSITH
jgi:curved DNA-binding protein CbpA